MSETLTADAAGVEIQAIDLPEMDFDTDSLPEIPFSPEVVDGARVLGVIFIAMWIIYLVKDHVIPSSRGSMGMMGSSSSGGGKLLAALGIILTMDLNLLNSFIRMAAGGLQWAWNTAAGFIGDGGGGGGLDSYN